jgi:hypothetical protein
MARTRERRVITIRATQSAAAILAALAVLAGTERALSQPTPRVVAVADVHGAYDSLLEILREADVVNAEGRWTGGDAVFVQTGDLTDRGAEIRRVLDFMMALEAEAERSGGRVAALLGNHEVMNMTRELRDASPRVYSTFADGSSEKRRRDAYAQYLRLVESRRRTLSGEPFSVMDEAAWMTAHPAGLLEYLEAFGREGRYGRWLRSRDAVARIGRTVFMHGGFVASTVSSVDDVNDQVRAELARFDSHTRRLVDRGVILPFFTFDETLEAARIELEAWITRLKGPDPVPFTDGDRQYLDAIVDLLKAGEWSIISAEGPLWFRGFALWSETEGQQAIDGLLDRLDADRFVVGHTPTPAARVVPRFDNRVFLIDTGMLREVYNGRATALEVRGDAVTAIYDDGRLTFTAPAPAGLSR